MKNIIRAPRELMQMATAGETQGLSPCCKAPKQRLVGSDASASQGQGVPRRSRPCCKPSWSPHSQPLHRQSPGKAQPREGGRRPVPLSAGKWSGAARGEVTGLRDPPAGTLGSASTAPGDEEGA